MSRGLKILGLLLAVGMAFAVSAAGASAASFKSESSPLFLSGEQTGTVQFKFTGGNINCKKSSLASGELTGTSQASVDLSPSCEGSFVGQKTIVRNNGCAFRFTASSTTAGAASIVCPAGKAIELETPSFACSFIVGAQTPGTPAVEYAAGGSGSTRDLLVTLKLAEVSYTTVGAVCGAAGSNGQITGSVTLKGYSDAGLTTQQGIFIE